MPTRILYIEDNPQNMSLVVRILTKVGGYEVLQAETGQSGVDVALAEYPDLILMDINLPDIDGLEATQRIKAHPKGNDIPIVAFTAATAESERTRFVEAGCDGYMAKPASADKLLSIVNDYL